MNTYHAECMICDTGNIAKLGSDPQRTSFMDAHMEFEHPDRTGGLWFVYLAVEHTHREKEPDGDPMDS